MKKRAWGTLNGAWVPQAARDAVVPFIRHWALRAGLSVVLLVGWLGIALSKFSRWSRRLGTPNRHNGYIPRDFCPQSNGKIERWFKAVKGECIRTTTPLSVEDARRLVTDFVTHYNTVRPHNAITHITPADKLAGRAEAIWAARETGAGRRPASRQDPGAGVCLTTTG